MSTRINLKIPDAQGVLELPLHLKAPLGPLCRPPCPLEEPLAAGASISEGARHQHWGGFGASSAQSFGAAPASVSGSVGTAFGAAPATGFGAASATAFGAASTPAFGAGTPTFGAASLPAPGAAPAPGFGATSAPAFGAATSMPAFGAHSGSAFGGGTSAPGASLSVCHLPKTVVSLHLQRLHDDTCKHVELPRRRLLPSVPV